METGVTPAPSVSQPPQPVNSANPTVNPSLTGAFGPFLVTPVQRPTLDDRRAQLAAAPPTQTTPEPQYLTTPLPTRDFSMPSPQTIAQEAAVVNESAQAAQAQEVIAAQPPVPQAAPQAPSQPTVAEPAQPPSPFDIATIQEEEKPKNRLNAGRQWRKWLMSGGIVGLCLLIAGGGLMFAQAYSNAHKVFRGTGEAAALTANGDKVKLKGEDKGRVNILLLGNGGLGHEAPDLTDTIIVASIDTVHHTASMLSVPRDLWVENAGTNPSKINAVYELGKYNEAGKIDNTNNNTKAVMAGFDTADQAVEKVLGIDIHYNLLVNFTSFKQAIDAVGGVNVNVPEILYDPTMAWENNNNPVLAPAGPQQMNGTKALMYVRSRETSSDFARGQRQRSVILALKDKVLTAGTLSNPLKLSGLANAFGDNMVTDMSLAEGMRAYDLIKGIDNGKVQTLDLVTPPNNLVTTTGINNQSVAVPRAGTFSYADIQAYVHQLFNPPQQAKTSTTATATNTSAVPEAANIAVLNGTARAGLAGTQAATIKAAGYNVSQIANAPTQGYAKTVVVDLSSGANPKTKQYLQTLYGVTAVNTLPAGIAPGNANFIVILGSDQAH
jgi:LCP family protein required for cell wall assembly